MYNMGKGVNNGFLNRVPQVRVLSGAFGHTKAFWLSAINPIFSLGNLEVQMFYSFSTAPRSLSGFALR